MRLKLDSYITLNKEAIDASNLCDRFSDDDLKRIGDCVWSGYNRDKMSRQKWETRSEAAMDLALQVVKDKNFPWANCSNIAFPLVTIAALQFSSRFYSAVVDAPDVVKCQTFGDDPEGEKAARDDRISTHMSWQVLEEDKGWEEQHDRLGINLSIVGTTFKKSYYDFSKRRNTSELVLARDLVLNYWSKSVEDSPRKTQIISMPRNLVHERVMRETYRNVLEESWYAQPPQPETNQQTISKDNRQGVTVPQTDESTDFTILEQHVALDLDDDGYAEPYIITIEQNSKSVLRIVARFEREEDIERVGSGKFKGKIIKISSMEYFTKYGFVPSPDGGIYDVGFGMLLGPLNETVNSNINQITDAGTMQNTAGGFLGRGAKIRGGTYTFAPFQWNRVDSTGDDLQKSIFPLPVREPSAVLFQLLVLLIDYVNRVSGSTDALVGQNPGQNQPAETTRTVVDQGLKIYSAIFKRVWRSMKEEFKKLFILNGMYLPVGPTLFGSEGQKVLKEDYLSDPEAISPAADPNVTSDQMQFAQAQALKQAAMSTAGYDLEVVEREYLKALKVRNIDQVYPGPKKLPAGKSEKIQIQELKGQVEMAWLQFEQQRFVTQLMEDRRVNEAEITKMMAEIEQMKVDAQGDQIDRQVNAMNTYIGLLKQRNESINARIEHILRAIEVTQKGGEDGKGTPPAQRGRVLELVARSGDQGTPGVPATGMA